MKCPYCASEIDDNSKTCQFCDSELTKICPYCREEISITETTCPLCSSVLKVKDKLKCFDYAMYLLVLLNITFTTFYVKYIGYLIELSKKDNSELDTISSAVAIGVFCSIPSIISILKNYKVRKFAISIFLNLFLCIISLISVFLYIK